MTDQTVQDVAVSKRVSDVLSALASEIMRYSASDMMRLMRREELSMPRLVSLMFLDRQGPASISDISEYLNLSLGNTSHLVDQLVCGGYVTRTEGPNDRRLKLVTLTQRGQSFVEEVKRVRVEELARRLEQLPAPVLETVLDAISEVVAHLRGGAQPPTDPSQRGE